MIGSMKKKIILLLAVAPFFFFSLGYIASYFLMSSSIYQTPNLIGLRLSQALSLAAENQATIKLLSQQEAPGIEPGVIISQKPTPGRLIKQNQTILVTVTKETPPTKAPDLELKNFNECKATTKDIELDLQSYPIEYPLNKGICIGQIPEKNAVVLSKKMIIYTAKEKENIFIMPNFIGKNLGDVIQKLNLQQISYKVFNLFEPIEPPFSEDFYIQNQKPKAGSFVTLDKNFTIQLEVE